jgi:hypothetical protein
MSKQAVAEREPEQALATIQNMTPMQMLDRAISSGSGIEVIKGLMDLQERWEKNQSRKAFDNAMADAKAEIPVIVKNRTVGFESKRTNERTSYKHEDMAEIARTVDPILTKHGLSYRYRTEMKEGGLIYVTCIVSHRDGHSEETTLPAGRDDSGSKNNLQAIGSTITYLQRYTLKAALGLAASDDDDARAVDVSQKLKPEQIFELQEALKAKGCPDEEFLRWAKVEKYEDIPAAYYESCLAAAANYVKKKK